MGNISMYIMAHKKFNAPENEIYKPMQVGAALHDDLGFLRDDTGDNISVKNPNYSELTGIYQVWKNDHDSDIVGICHYRRYFADENFDIVSGELIESILEKADIITTPKAVFKCSLKEDYINTHNATDLDKTRDAIGKLYPDYLNIYDEVLNGNSTYFANMFVAKKEIFDSYCGWLFDILFEVEKNLDISQYDDYNRRVFGFISERLLLVWIKKMRLKTCSFQVITVGDKAESSELVKWGVDCMNAGRYDELAKKYDERRAKYADLFLETSDAKGHLNFLYELAEAAKNGNGRSAIMGPLLKRYVQRNYYLEYMKSMFDVLKTLKVKGILLGEDHALYGIDLCSAVGFAPLAMTAQDLFYNLKILEKALKTVDEGQIRTCFLVAWDGILYEKTEKHPAGAGIKSVVYDVIFPDIIGNKERKDNGKSVGSNTTEFTEKSHLFSEDSGKQWDFVPDGLLSDDEKNTIEITCRNLSLKRGGFFNDINPRGKNMNISDPMDFDIKKDNPDVKRIFDENRTALETLARRCNELNARFVVVSPPCMSSDAHRIALREELLSVLENLPYLVEYQNLNAKIWEGIFEADDFYNEELLNEYGAKKFTQILNELCSLEEEGVTG